MNLDIFLIILSSTLFGMSINKALNTLKLNRRENKRKKLKNGDFLEVLQNFSSIPRKINFKSRVNNTIYFSTELKSYGKVELVYLLDRADVAIFRNDECIHTSDDVDRKTIDDITENLDKNFDAQINDVVNVLGITFNREEFERAFGVKTEDIKKLFNFSQSESEIDKIYFDNEMKYDIDEILDRINIVGINNLTKAELDFLRKWGNEKGN